MANVKVELQWKSDSIIEVNQEGNEVCLVDEAVHIKSRIETPKTRYEAIIFILQGKSSAAGQPKKEDVEYR